MPLDSLADFEERGGADTVLSLGTLLMVQFLEFVLESEESLSDCLYSNQTSIHALRCLYASADWTFV